MMLSLDAASWASFTQRLTTSKLHFSRCCGQWDLLRGQKEKCPSCHTPVVSHMQPGPLHCPEPKTKDGQTAVTLILPAWQISCLMPVLTIYHVRGGSKPLTQSLPNRPSVWFPSDILFYLQPTLAGPSHSYLPGKTQGRSWRHWEPCPQLLVSCSAQQPAAWCSVAGECRLRRETMQGRAKQTLQKLLLNIPTLLLHLIQTAAEPRVCLRAWEAGRG